MLDRITMTMLTLLLAGFGLASEGLAHATLETKQAVVGAPYKAVVRIGHGCEGKATTRIQVKIPEGVIAAKPMPKPGWTITTTKGKYARSYKFYHGAELAEGVTEITWSGGLLPDDFYDEFVFSTFVADALQPGQTIHFPVVQTCETGEHRWVEIPAPGQDAHALKGPAPALTLVAAPAKAAAAESVFRLKDLVIAGPWARATPGGAKVGGGYVKITNNGSTADRLVGGSLVSAGAVEVHEMRVDGGVMQMRHLADGIEIKPGETIELKPGGNHLMFMELKSGLVAGRPVAGTLVFQQAGTIAVEFAVAPIGAGKGPSGHSHH